jgi:hypothetical protein
VAVTMHVPGPVEVSPKMYIVQPEAVPSVTAKEMAPMPEPPLVVSVRT